MVNVGTFYRQLLIVSYWKKARMCIIPNQEYGMTLKSIILWFLSPLLGEAVSGNPPNIAGHPHSLPADTVGLWNEEACHFGLTL